MKEFYQLVLAGVNDRGQKVSYSEIIINECWFFQDIKFVEDN
jgi:hypothetical protein